MKLASDGPGIAPAAEMAKLGNTAYPFASALTVLDIGCGPGQVTNEVLKAYGTSLPFSTRVVASDLAPGIIEQVKKRKKEEVAAGNILWDRVEPVICNAMDLSSFPDKSVSHVFGGFVFFMVPQPRVALKEAHRVLTEQHGGGVLAVSSWQGSEWQELMGFPSKVRPEKVIEMPSTWSTIEDVRGELEATGFRDIDVHTVQAYMPFDDYDEIARYILTKFPGMIMITDDMSHTELEEVRDLMVEHIKEKHPTTPSRLIGTAIIGVGRK